MQLDAKRGRPEASFGGGERTKELTPSEVERLRAEAMAELAARDDDDDDGPDEILSDQARGFRESWNAQWYGAFDDATRIPPMRFTDEPPDPRRHIAFPRTTLQVFSVEVVKLWKKKGRRRPALVWPLHVYGLVALRDSIDCNRNVLFYRARDDCQVLLASSRRLELTGPSRAVTLVDPATFEVDLRAKNGAATEADDERLSFVAAGLLWAGGDLRSTLFRRDYASQLSTVRLTLGLLVRSVEATVAVHVAGGATWPDDGRRARIRIAAATASVPGEEIVLLDSGGVDGGHHHVPVADDGGVMLSRRVASVELSGELKVSVKAWKGDDDHRVVQRDEAVFKPKEAGRSYGTLDLGFCRMDVTVAWSLISST